jgi:hypothetical protein
MQIGLETYGYESFRLLVSNIALRQLQANAAVWDHDNIGFHLWFGVIRGQLHVEGLKKRREEQVRKGFTVGPPGTRAHTMAKHHEATRFCIR